MRIWVRKIHIFFYNSLKYDTIKLYRIIRSIIKIEQYVTFKSNPFQFASHLRQYRVFSKLETPKYRFQKEHRTFDTYQTVQKPRSIRQPRSPNTTRNYTKKSRYAPSKDDKAGTFKYRTFAVTIDRSLRARSSTLFIYCRETNYRVFEAGLWGSGAGIIRKGPRFERTNVLICHDLSRWALLRRWRRRITSQLFRVAIIYQNEPSAWELEECAHKSRGRCGFIYFSPDVFGEIRNCFCMRVEIDPLCFQ